MAWNPAGHYYHSGTGASTTTTASPFPVDERERRQQAALGAGVDERAARQAVAMQRPTSATGAVSFTASRTPVSPAPSSAAAVLTVTTVPVVVQRFVTVTADPSAIRVFTGEYPKRGMVVSFTPGNLTLSDGSKWFIDSTSNIKWKMGDQVTITYQHRIFSISGLADVVEPVPVPSPVVVSTSSSSVGGPIFYVPASPTSSMPSSTPAMRPQGSSGTGSYSTFPLTR